MTDKFWVRDITIDHYKVVVTAGGITVIFPTGDFTSLEEPPQEPPSDQELQKIAERAIDEFQRFCASWAKKF